jgi:hypothetical protein
VSTEKRKREGILRYKFVGWTIFVGYQTLIIFVDIKLIELNPHERDHACPRKTQVLLTKLHLIVNITRPVANYDDKSTHATSLDHAASSKVIASQDSSHKGKQYLTSQPPCSTLTHALRHTHMSVRKLFSYSKS